MNPKIKSFKYNLGKSRNGLYADIDKVGQAYNMELFLKKFSGRRKTGILHISSTKFNGSIRFVRENPFSEYYLHEISGLQFKGVHFRREIAKAKTIFVKVIPTKK